VVVNEIGELASPPTGGVTVCGMLTLMPLGALPTHETEKVTGPLNPPTESTTTLVPPLRPGIVDTVLADGRIENSWMGAAEGVTGARTAGMLPIITGISVECEITPLDAVTRSV